MSQYMFIGVKDKLSKTDFSAKDIYIIPEIYKNSLWFSDGVLFDENIPDDQKSYLQKNYQEYTWYNIKGFLTPLRASTRYKEDFPDQYEAAYQMSQWFCKYVKKLRCKGNEVLVVNLWIGEDNVKIKTIEKILKISKVDLSNYEIPQDIVFKLEI